MMIKWIGAFFVFLSCGGFGIMLSQNYKKEIELFRQLDRMLEFMCCELDYRRTPLPELCRRSSWQQSGILKGVFTDLAEEMDAQIAPDVKCCMQITLNKHQELPKSVADVLNELGKVLGIFDISGQIKGIEATKEYSRRVLANLEQGKAAHIHTYQTLGFCAGAALAILFV